MSQFEKGFKAQDDWNSITSFAGNIGDLFGIGNQVDAILGGVNATKYDPNKVYGRLSSLISENLNKIRNLKQEELDKLQNLVSSLPPNYSISLRDRINKANSTFKNNMIKANKDLNQINDSINSANSLASQVLTMKPTEAKKAEKRFNELLKDEVQDLSQIERRI